MPGVAERQAADIIKSVADASRKTIKKDAQARFERFLAAYFQNVPPQDLKTSTPETLFSIAHGHFQLGAARRPNTTLVRVFNPDRKKDGWHSTHTIVEIVTDDMPFLVDSVTSALNRQNLTVHLVVHPILKINRDGDGRFVDVAGAGASDGSGKAESFMHIQVTQQSGKRPKEIETEIKHVLADVRTAVEDWRPMRAHMTEVIEELSSVPKSVDKEEVAEVRDFLKWMHDNQFTFLGYREYVHKTGAATVKIERKNGMGILRDPETVVFEEMRKIESASDRVKAFVKSPELLMIVKTNRRSTVHRPVHMDAVGVKRFDAQGRVVGQHLFVGLFTAAAYSRSPWDIPLLRRKLKKVVDRAGFPASSHDGKALAHILETYPRDELLQVGDDDLFNTALGILHLQDRQRVTLFVRRDNFERYMSCLIFLPRDRYTTALRLRMQAILEGAFEGEAAAHHATLGDLPLAQLHLILKTTPGAIPDYDVDALETELAEAARSWSDRLSEALVCRCGEERGLKLLHRYGDAFSVGYQDAHAGEVVLGDIELIEDLLEKGGIGLNIYRPDGTPETRVRFKVYHPDKAVLLSDVLPLFEHMGFKVLDESPYRVTLKQNGDKLVMIHDFGLDARDGKPVDLGAIRDNFQESFRRVWFGEMESDGFNALVPGVGLGWRDVVIVRAICKFLRQAGITFSQAYMEQTLAGNGRITRQIVDLFKAMFDPKAKNHDKQAESIKAAINQELEAVVSADEDRILRRFVNVVDSMLRTNFYQTGADGGPKPYLSFKLNSKNLDELPLPRPLREIFVYSPRMEGVHLRFGLVARGGLRWSDRREDFRTEILGLVKAQQVKNAVIVPVGSKGGFVCKLPTPPGDRDAFMKEGIECYKILISGLLDITDNIKGPKVVPPKDVVRRDPDDPYLVVAADKGTATFSDIANGVSLAYGHWLGDAFASGGSQGYDHKKMGITARGAWESVKRHFREIGKDIQKEDFTVVGVGDMSGDVFGNGMLLSPHIKLVGAFNHMHIFIDPNPDRAKSLEERQRLFNLPRSAWTDYDKSLLSKGGAIYERSAKSLALSPEARKCFGIDKEKVTPNELMQTLLKSEVDLMWFGGIGTYIKAETESNADVGDRANDAIRVDGGDIRAKVIGEGANLGTTQLGRIEYALAGGRLNTDSIDNSAGVNCSDHEVNIKILIDSVVAKGGLDQKQRNKLLAEMTEEVGGLVLKSNYAQSQAITMVEARGVLSLDNQSRLMRRLERADRLNRAVEFLPDDETLNERKLAKKGLTRPEIAILMSYSKIWLYDELLASDVPNDAELERDLLQYFPTPLRAKYKGDIGEHRLRREIITTRLTNSLVNRVGGTFVAEFMEKTGKGAAEIARAYAIAREVHKLRELWEAIEALDNIVPTSVQTDMILASNHLIEWVTLWFLRNGKPGLDIGEHIKEFQAGITDLSDGLAKALPAHYASDLNMRAKHYTDKGVPEKLALAVASLVNVYSGCDVVRLANSRKMKVLNVARVYFAVGTRFHLGGLRAAADSIGADTHWQQLAIAALIEEIYSHQLTLANRVLDVADGKMDPEKAVQAWIDKNKTAVAPTDQLLSELWATAINDLSMIAVASRQLRAMTDAGRAK
jgi:glutamate dehydrogenase